MMWRLFGLGIVFRFYLDARIAGRLRVGGLEVVGDAFF
jgi:hypothetical protein